MDTIIHPVFSDKPEDSSKIWRYLNISKFISLLESKTLHFTRIDQYGDHFEGVWSKNDLNYWNNMQGFNVPSFTEGMKRTKVAASCWFESEYESAAMWPLYAANKDGIAITTSFGTLSQQLNLKKEEFAQYLDLLDAGRVRYIDHVNDSIINKHEGEKLPNTLWPFMLKNISYKHEQEIRVLAVANQHYNIEESGMDIPVDIENFIQEIIVSPLSDDWFFNAVESMLVRYNLSHKLKVSTLSKKSFYMKVIEKIHK